MSARQLLASWNRTLTCTGEPQDLWDILSFALPDDAPGRLYVVWAALTDIWELSPESRAEAEGSMREAAQEFLAISDYTSELDGYLSRWYERLDIPA